ncbi:Rha family transcriptional regulator [Vibrio galatheae]|uniref:Rha family transcriptional regulator n=1 Tax=Vibrio galatheae TaxID=579748 RepID=UPI0006984812|nr:Rha family transcriptional regulator [Vibrio galatheae]
MILVHDNTSKQAPVIHTGELTMSSREIAELTGKHHHHVIRDIRKQECAYIEVYGNQTKFGLVKYVDGKGELRDEYQLTKSQALFVVSGYNPVLRAKVQKRMEDLEQQLQDQPSDLQVASTMDSSQLQLLLKETKAKEVAELERDHAVRTKSQISRTREASVMGKLGAATKRIKALEDKVQDTGEYLSVIAAKIPDRVDTDTKDNAQSWRVLKQLSSLLGKDIKKAVCPRFGEVNTYHIDVIARFKELYL